MDFKPLLHGFSNDIPFYFVVRLDVIGKRLVPKSFIKPRDARNTGIFDIFFQETIAVRTFFFL